MNKQVDYGSFAFLVVNFGTCLNAYANPIMDPITKMRVEKAFELLI